MKKNWFYYFEGERAVGPLEKSDVIERIHAGKLGPYQLMIRDGEEDWRPALAFEEFRGHLLNVRTNPIPSQSWVILKRQDAGGHLSIESLGPFSSDEIRAHLQAGKVEYTDYAWKDGMHQWRRLSSLKEFSPFEEPIKAPQPLIDMPPAPQIAKQVTKEEALKKVEVVQRTVETIKSEPPKPKEAAGPDLAAKQVEPPKIVEVPKRVEQPAPPPKMELPPEPPSVAPSARTSVISKGSPAGIERRRLPRTTHIELKPRGNSEVPVETVVARKKPVEDIDPALDKTVVIEQPKSKTSVKEQVKEHKRETNREAKSKIPSPPPEDKPAPRIRLKEKEIPRDEDDDPTSVITSVNELYNARITLPQNWKQILIILILLGALYIRLFGAPDTIPLSQVPAIGTETVPPPPPPPPSSQAAPQELEQPAPSRSPRPQQPAPEQEATAPDDEEVQPRPHIVNPVATIPAPAPKKKLPHQPTRLHAHMSVQTDGGASLQVDTDATGDQSVLIEISSGPGLVLDHSHIYRRAKWMQGKPISLGGELPPGYYRLHASVGNLSTEERFEIGTHVKGFSDRLRASRKQSAYDFWSERKRLFVLANQVSRLLGSRHPNELDRLSHFQSTSFAFSDLWADLKEICQLGKKMDPSAKGRLQTLQGKISLLTIWK